MSIEDMAAAAAHGNRRGFRGRGPWTGVAWDIETGNEVGDCGHRHKVSTDEARNCPGLDHFDTIEVVTVRTDELSALLAALAESREQYVKLAEHHRQCELAGTELCEAAKEAVIYSADGPSRDRLNEAMMAWDAHQWPEIMNAEMGDEQ